MKDGQSTVRNDRLKRHRTQKQLHCDVTIPMLGICSTSKAKWYDQWQRRYHGNQSRRPIGSEEAWGRRRINPSRQYLIMGNKQSCCCWSMMSLSGTAELRLQPAEVVSSEQERWRHSQQRQACRIISWNKTDNNHLLTNLILNTIHLKGVNALGNQLLLNQ